VGNGTEEIRLRVLNTSPLKPASSTSVPLCRVASSIPSPRETGFQVTCLLFLAWESNLLKSRHFRHSGNKRLSPALSFEMLGAAEIGLSKRHGRLH
jgi:hypothetical protein